MASTLSLFVGLALLAMTGARLAAALRMSTPTTFLVGAFVFAHAELLLLALGLSLFRGFTATNLLISLAFICVGVLAATRGARSGIAWRAALRPLLSDPVLTTLTAVAGLGLAYSFAMGMWVHQVEDDILTFHGVRAGLWHQHEGITYLAGLIDLRNNAYPPGGELGPLTTMTLGGSLHFIALDQFLACLTIVVGVVGIARRIGFGLRQAAFGGLLVATLPIVALQAGTAMSDLMMPVFLVAASLFLLDRNRVSPWLAGLATALAIDVKLSVIPGIPFLLLLAWLARPVALRRMFLALGAGAAAGAFWYVVNLAETGTWDGHVTEEFRVDRSPPETTARILRVAIEFIDLSGGRGRDRWLYAIVALVVLLVAATVWLRSGRPRAALVTGALAAGLTLVPLLLVPFAHGLVRAYFKGWLVLGRRDLAAIDSGRDITKSASNFSWFGPLGSLLVLGAAVLVVLAVRRGRLDRLALACALAPAYWVVAVATLFFYQDWLGRFFVFPMALSAATWGIVLRWRAAAWGVTAIAATTVLLALANDAKRPSGLPLLERDKPRSIWTSQRWVAPDLRQDYQAPIRFLDERLPSSADIGLAITTSDPVYPFFGTGLGHRISFVYEDDRDAPGVDWVFVRPGNRTSLCAAWRTALRTPDGWRILHRAAGRTCSR